jgi:hypothetical protein
LTAILQSGGTYAGIIDANSVEEWVRLVLVNGLTHNDNPVGNNGLILPGLSISHIISGTQTNSLTYQATANEEISLNVASITAGALTAEAFFGGKSLGKLAVDEFSFTGDILNVTAPGTGEMTLKVSSKGAPKNSLYTVAAGSNLPIQNCTVGIKATNKSTGLTPGGKAGVAIGTIGAVALLGGGVFFILKKFLFPPKTGPMPHNPPQMIDPNQGTYMDPGKAGLMPQVQPVYAPPGQPPMAPYSPPPQFYSPPPQPFMNAMPPPIPPPTNPHQPHNQRPRDQDRDNDGSDCECSDPSDLEDNQSPGQQSSQPGQKHKHKYHRIKWKRENDPKHHHHPTDNLTVECKDDKCPLNDKKHECKKPKDGEPPLPCPCNCVDPNCPSNTPEEKRRRLREKRRKEFRNSALATGRSYLLSEAKHQALAAVGI